MLDIIVGCMRRQHMELVFFNMEMTVGDYPPESQAEALRDWLNENTIEIVDEVVYVMDGYSGDVIWEHSSDS